jgi:hypothetical protein
MTGNSSTPLPLNLFGDSDIDFSAPFEDRILTGVPVAPSQTSRLTPSPLGGKYESMTMSPPGDAEERLLDQRSRDRAARTGGLPLTTPAERDRQRRHQELFDDLRSPPPSLWGPNGPPDPGPARWYYGGPLMTPEQIALNPSTIRWPIDYNDGAFGTNNNTSLSPLANRHGTNAMPLVGLPKSSGPNAFPVNNSAHTSSPPVNRSITNPMPPLSDQPDNDEFSSSNEAPRPKVRQGRKAKWSCERCHNQHDTCTGPPQCDKCRNKNHACLWPPNKMGRNNFQNWRKEDPANNVAKPWGQYPGHQK